MKTDPKSESEILRQKAEEKLNERKGSISETDNLKLINELQVHQIELEMQNEELVLAREQAILAKEKYANLFDFAPSGYITLSKESEIIELNFCAASMLCKERSRLIKNRFDLFVSVDSRPIFNSFFERMFTNKTKETCEVILIIDCNLPIHVHLIGIVDKKSDQCLLTIINITDRKQADLIISKQTKELQKLNSDKDRFISILGHDLRSPFVSMMGFSDLLVKNIRKYDIDKIESYANQINQSTKKGFNLLENLLVWANAQSGKLAFNPQKLNLKTIYTLVVETLNPIANEKNITINYFEEKDLIVFADTNMLQTILRNLISNAIKFTNKGGKINISAIKSDSFVTVTVSDNGIGIEYSNIGKIFDLTKIYSTKGTAEEKGTGLGLILCKEFVEIHGGNIWVESEIGKGSKFHFSLSQIEKSTITKMLDWKHKKILFVDDELMTHILIEADLEDTEVQITFANNGKEAVNLCKNNRYDIIIMDINMPVMNGYEATTEIRKLNKDIVIIAHTGNVLKREDCIAVGFTNYLQKSGNQENLLQLLIEYFE